MEYKCLWINFRSPVSFHKTDDYYAAKAELLINEQDELEFWRAGGFII